MTTRTKDDDPDKAPAATESTADLNARIAEEASKALAERRPPPAAS